MPVLRQFVFAALVSSPAILLTAGAAFIGSGLDDAARAGSNVQLAQESGESTEEDAAAASETEAGEPEAGADDAAATEESVDEGPVEFTEEFLNDPAHHEAGKVVWETCSGCHGARAYPGKGPQLRPNRYTPDFVFDRVTNGYKKMPPWQDIFTKEERMDVVAYILSDDFSP